MFISFRLLTCYFLIIFLEQFQARSKIDHFLLKEGWVELVKACYISVSSRHQAWMLRKQLSMSGSGARVGWKYRSWSC